MQRRIKVRKMDMPQLILRIPTELKEKLEAKAFENNRSVNAEVTAMLEEMLKDQQVNKPHELNFTATISVESQSKFEIGKAITSISEQLADLAEKVSELEKNTA